MGKNKIIVTFYCICLTFYNFLLNAIINIPFDDWFSCRFVRPFIARLLGLKCGKSVSLRKGIYYGNARHISIGSNCYLNREIFLDAYDKIRIGDRVGIAYRVIIITSAHLTDSPHHRVGELVGNPVTIQDGVWIGAGVVIGPGVTIGESSIVAAGAVVMRTMPSNSLIAGNPARVIKMLKQGIDAKNII